MAHPDLQMNPQMEQIHGEIRDTIRALANGFQKLDKIKDSNRQSKQLEELTGKMRECKRLIKEFDREIKDEESRNPPEVTKQLNDEKQSMIKELNSYVALRKTYMSTLGGKRVELFDMGTGPSEPTADENVQVASEMSNQELINAGTKTMDETDQAIERSKQVVHQTIEVGTQTATTLKGQTEQMGRVVNELDTIQFSIKKASQLVKEIGRQVATDKCIMLFLFLIVCGVIAIIVVKIVNPNNRDIRDIPGLAPPAPTTRRLLNGFQKLDKIKDSNRQSKQLEDLTGKMRECKRLIKEFDLEIKGEESRNPPEVTKQLNDEKQSMIKELNSYVALRKTYMNNLGGKRVELFDMENGTYDSQADENVRLASEMSNQELIDTGMKTMDETDQAIERSKQVVHQTIEVGTQTAATLKGQIVNPGNGDIRDIPGLAPPVPSRRLLFTHHHGVEAKPSVIADFPSSSVLLAVLHLMATKP
ncbi:novel plant snare [Striga asiatica]|uniref:Novel plant snare n=1 Tax=Striga asiatica TaxID=4170 RepID=A0A5A7PEY0_STRAF|nr:novel plant snare [Striga asiatica]